MIHRLSKHDTINRLVSTGHLLVSLSRSLSRWNSLPCRVIAVPILPFWHSRRALPAQHQIQNMTLLDTESCDGHLVIKSGKTKSLQSPDDERASGSVSAWFRNSRGSGPRWLGGRAWQLALQPLGYAKDARWAFGRIGSASAASLTYYRATIQQRRTRSLLAAFTRTVRSEPVSPWAYPTLSSITALDSVGSGLGCS